MSCGEIRQREKQQEGPGGCVYQKLRVVQSVWCYKRRVVVVVVVERWLGRCVPRLCRPCTWLGTLDLILRAVKRQGCFTPDHSAAPTPAVLRWCSWSRNRV